MAGPYKVLAFCATIYSISPHFFLLVQRIFPTADMGKSRWRRPPPAPSRRYLGPAPPVPSRGSAPRLLSRGFARWATTRRSPAPASSQRSPAPALLPQEATVLRFSLRLRRIHGCNLSSWRKTFTNECLSRFSKVRLEFFRSNGKFIEIDHENNTTVIIVNPDSYEAPSLAKVVDKPEDVDLVVSSSNDFVQILCEKDKSNELKNKIFLASLSRGFKFAEY